jgi:hypothetical protein
LQFPKNIYGLAGKGHKVGMLHFHSFGRNVPFSLVKVKFRPFSLT